MRHSPSISNNAEPALPPRAVVFVGGTSYSGSTMLGLMLGSGEQCVSLGECKWAFHSSLPYHRNPSCQCGDSECTLWSDVRQRNEADFFPTVFERFPQARFVVDTSKALDWIVPQMNWLKDAGIGVRHVLIWKTPETFARSMIKRQKAEQWEDVWKGYHLSYLRHLEQFTAVRYEDLAATPAETLSRTCERLGMQYFPEKEHYWNHTHHCAFGNASACWSLHEPDSESYENFKHWRGQVVDPRHDLLMQSDSWRRIRAVNQDSIELSDDVRYIIEMDPTIAAIRRLLEDCENRGCVNARLRTAVFTAPDTPTRLARLIRKIRRSVMRSGR